MVLQGWRGNAPALSWDAAESHDSPSLNSGTKLKQEVKNNEALYKALNKAASRHSIRIMLDPFSLNIFPLSVPIVRGARRPVRLANTSAQRAVYWHRIAQFLAAKVQTALKLWALAHFLIGGSNLENAPHILITCFEWHVLKPGTHGKPNQINESLSPSSLRLCAGGAGFGEEPGRCFAGGSQAPALQRQLPQSAPVYPRHPSQSLEKQATGKVSGETLWQILDNSLLAHVAFKDVNGCSQRMCHRQPECCVVTISPAN